MFGIVFKLFFFGISSVLLLYLLANVFRNARRLEARIQAFKEEQAELEKRQGPINPYAALAELYAENSRETARPPKRRRGNSA